jgi:N-dimethylarginine dimethylaminohydrolase
LNNQVIMSQNFGSQSMYGRLKRVLIKPPTAAFKSQAHLDENALIFGYMGVPDYELVLQEYNVFERILLEHGIETLKLPADPDVGLDSIYAHDPVKVTRHGAIYLPMGKALRCPEGQAARRFLEAQGVPTLGVIEPPAQIEGGDIVWLDEHTVAIARGYRTNDAGIAAFRDLTRDFVAECITVPLPHGEGPEACLHLMSLISIVDRDLAVVYSKYLPVFFREYLLQRGIKLVETPDAEYDYLGTNVLALGPRNCLTIAGNPVVKAGLEAAGAVVHTYPGREVSYRGTGGPTCLTCPVLRE